MRKVETKHMQLHPHAANDADTFAEIDFGMSRRMRKRNDHLSRLRARQPHVVFYDRIAARKAVFDPQPLVFPALCSAHSQAAPNSGTSWQPSPGSIRKPAPPPAGSSPQQKQTVEPLRRSPLQTSPAALPNQDSERVSPESGRVLLRHAAAKCRRSVAYYCSAAYIRGRSCLDRKSVV